MKMHIEPILLHILWHVIFNQIEKKYNNYELNFLKIWNIQNIYDELKEQIEITAYEVFKFISKPIGTAMITEYCKKKFVGNMLKRKLDINFQFCKYAH